MPPDSLKTYAESNDVIFFNSVTTLPIFSFIVPLIIEVSFFISFCKPKLYIFFIK